MSLARTGNMISKLWISARLPGILLTLLLLFVILPGDINCHAAESSNNSPATTPVLDDALIKSLSESFPIKELEDAMISLNRTKRQSINLLQLAQLTGGLGGLNNSGQGNVATKPGNDGALASCQLTNLLLYQLIQQRQAAAAANPFLSLANANLQGLGSNLNLNIASGLPLNAAAAGGSLINPFPAINQNLIFPTLHTYTTTKTFITKLTTTAVITIPLLFGNKPVPTTITRTKTYDVTTSEVQTLTSTVRPTVVTQVINPTPALQNPSGTVSPSLNDVDEEAPLASAPVSSKKYQTSAVPEYEDEEPAANSRVSSSSCSIHSELTKGSGGSGSSSSGKRRKPGRNSQKNSQTSQSTRSSSRDRDYQERDAQIPNRYGSSSTTRDRDDDYETDYQQYASPGKSNTNTNNNNNNAAFSKRKYGNIYEDDVAVDEDPAAAQYPDDYSYYTRRLKRGEQYGDEQTNDKEYVLEPSTDGDFSSNYQKYERCPPIPKAAEAATVTVTKTETRTVTKFLGQSTLSSNINLNGASRTFESTKPARKRSRSRNRSTSSGSSSSSSGYADQSGAYSAPAPSSERPTRGTTEDTRAQILLRSRSRHNSNYQQQQQQPNYDYYRG